MPRSMTGFGLGQADENGHSVTVECRSVNNRYLEVSFKLPRVLYSFETKLRDIIRSKIQRGRVSVFIKEEWDRQSSPSFKIEEGKARSYMNALNELSKTLNLSSQVDLDHLITIPDLISPVVDESYRERLLNLTVSALEAAMEEFIAVSTAEGDNLVADMFERLALIEQEKATIGELAGLQVKIYRDKLEERLRELLTDNRLDPQRLEAEIALTADKLDISEELVRLDSHLKLFRNTLEGDKPVGKSLGFTLQEMGREANTIASKAWLVDISQAAIRIKEIIEQMREQIQNLE